MSRAEFFRDANKKQLTLTLVGGVNYEWIKVKRPQNLKPRAICKVQTNAIWLEGSENDGKGSYLDMPPASLMEYDGEKLKIFQPAVREMNAEEKANQAKAEAEQARYTADNPYSDGYWHMKDFYRNCSTPWISPMLGTVKGKKAALGSDYGKIVDKAIKGTMILEYLVSEEKPCEVPA